MLSVIRSLLFPLEPAPATIPATNEVTFNPAFAPLSVGTVISRSARSCRPTRPANATTGTSPAADSKFGSSNTARRTGRA